MMNYFYYMILNLLSLIFLMVFILMGIAFIVLMERKLLGFIQDRKGPSKVGVLGIFQPFSDAIKLILKELFIIYKSNYFLYFICPMIMFLFMFMMWMFIPYLTNIYYLNYSVLMILMIMSLMSYMVLMIGWSSNSLYSMLGTLRSMAQLLSYEVSFILIILVIMILSESYSFMDFLLWQEYVWNLLWLFPLFIMFFISSLAEMNRSPMDFIEGESELVSGFNIEYFSGSFIMIFMAEYGMIIFFSSVMIFMFMNLNLVMYLIMMNMLIMLVIYIRGILPRMRYDELMYLCWKVILPLILNYLVFILGFKILFLML